MADNDFDSSNKREFCMRSTLTADPQGIIHGDLAIAPSKTEKRVSWALAIFGVTLLSAFGLFGKHCVRIWRAPDENAAIAAKCSTETAKLNEHMVTQTHRELVDSMNHEELMRWIRPMARKQNVAPEAPAVSPDTMRASHPRSTSLKNDSLRRRLAEMQRQIHEELTQLSE